MTEIARQEALEKLRGAVEAAQRRTQVAFDYGFVKSNVDSEAPPLARLVQGGRGGEVRLKLYLTITMMATRDPFDLRRSRTPQAWARLLALPQPTEQGARRISASLSWLETADLVKLTPRKGSTPAIQLLHPVHEKRPYTRPISHYVGVPIDFWLNGWIVDLSATGIALLMVLIDNGRGEKDKARYVTTLRRSEYGLSHGTWTRATKELNCYGLVKVDRDLFGDDFDSARLRNTYQLNLARLETQATPEERAAAAAALVRPKPKGNPV